MGDMIYIDDFIWLSDIVDKLATKHHVSQDETEEIFFNRPGFRFVERGCRPGEDVYSAAGQTDSGRYLVVFFILKPSQQALILSARDMDKKERRRHERKKRTEPDKSLPSDFYGRDRRVLGYSQPRRSLG